MLMNKDLYFQSPSNVATSLSSFDVGRHCHLKGPGIVGRRSCEYDLSTLSGSRAAI